MILVDIPYHFFAPVDTCDRLAEAILEGVRILTLEKKALSEPEGEALLREEEVAEKALDRLDEEYSKGTLDREIQEEFAERLEQFQMHLGRPRSFREAPGHSAVQEQERPHLEGVESKEFQRTGIPCTRSTADPD